MADLGRIRIVALLASATVLTVGGAYGQAAAPPSPSGAAPNADAAARGADAAPPAREGGEEKAAAPKRPSATGGYSWSDKPTKRRPRRRARHVKYNPSAPHANFPGFRLLPDGQSLVWVVLDRQTSVEVRHAANRVTYVMTGAQVYTRNNTRPLVTTHFNTPLQSMRLVQHADGAHLELVLREPAEPVHQLVRGPRGMLVLKVQLPRATRQYASNPAEPAVKVGGTLPPAGATGSARARPTQ